MSNSVWLKSIWFFYKKKMQLKNFGDGILVKFYEGGYQKSNKYANVIIDKEISHYKLSNHDTVYRYVAYKIYKADGENVPESLADDSKKLYPNELYRTIRSLILNSNESYSGKVCSIFTLSKRVINSIIGIYLTLFVSTLLSDNNIVVTWFIDSEEAILTVLLLFLSFYILYSWSFNLGDISSKYQDDESEEKKQQSVTNVVNLPSTSPEHKDRLRLISNEYLLKSRPYMLLVLVIVIKVTIGLDWIIDNPHMLIINGMED